MRKSAERCVGLGFDEGLPLVLMQVAVLEDKQGGFLLPATDFIFISTKVSCQPPKIGGEDRILNIESLNCCQMDQDHVT